MRRSVDEHGSALQSWRERARAHEVRSAGPVSSWPSDWERWREGDREGRRRERFAETVTHMPSSGAQRSGGDGDGDEINLRNSTRITIKSLTESLHRTARSLEASEASFTEEPSCRPRRTETGERAGESVAEVEAARLKLRFSISLHSADKARACKTSCGHWNAPGDLTDKEQCFSLQGSPSSINKQVQRNGNQDCHPLCQEELHLQETAVHPLEWASPLCRKEAL